jgi:two-component system, LytTR family, sensor kinase
MKPRVARAWLLLAVFALLGVLSATEQYVSEAFAPPPPPASQAGASAAGDSAFPAVLKAPTAARPLALRVFRGLFRYYVAWAVATPGIFYLARRFSLTGNRRARAVAVHLLVPVAGSIPFFCVRVVLGIALGADMPWWTTISEIPWRRMVVLQSLGGAPVYWLIVGIATVIQLTREQVKQELREAELRRSLAAAQLDGLKFKLQPHFLFNTLNAIGSLAGTGDTDAAGTIIERLGTLLRLSMETSGRQLVPLEEELALADAYLAIEEVRFGDRLRVVRRIAPDARRALVPNLILQPLIENALVHGLGRRLDASLLEIAARRDGRVLRLAVRDDGPGLPEGWTIDACAGSGLRNVRERIRGLFPGESGLELQDSATGGAVALLSIPFADAQTTGMGVENHTWTASERSSWTTSSLPGGV